MDFTPPPVTIAAETAAREQWDSLLQAIGTIRAVRGVEVSAETSGEVTAIAVSSGDQVEQGQLILSLNDRVEKASRENQIASLKLARLLFLRDQELVAQKSIPQSQYDRTRADLERAVAQLAETEARLDDKHIQAPFAGTVGIIHVRVGSYLEPGDAITTLQDLTELEIDFTVPARYFPQLRQGQQLAVRVDAFPGQVFHATLQALDARVDVDTRNLLLRASLAPGSRLLPGMFAQVELNLDQPQTVVTVPETALTYSLQGNSVFLLEEDENGLRATPRVVETGATRDGRIAILSGLAEGDRVGVTGQKKRVSGARGTCDDSVRLGDI